MELLRIYLVLLVCTLAVAAERRGPRPLKPLMPTLEERRQHPNSDRRPFRPFRPLRPASPKAHRPAQAEATLQFTRMKAEGAEREPQPEFAGRVAVEAHPGLRIINGNKAVLGQFPWQAGILEKVSGGKLWCGGSVISSHWVLTAAHCIDDEPDSYLISVGTTKSEGSTDPSLQTRDTVQVFQHQDYNPYFIDNDIGCIQVETPFTFNAYVRPVRLPPYSFATDMMVGKQGTVSGWGKSKDTDQWITPDLMYIQNTIDDGSACLQMYGNSWIPNKICVQTPDVKSFCSGDSGGAFVYEEEPGSWTQIGIVSFGASAGCELKLPTAYTRLASFLEFVEDTTNIAIRD